MYIPRVHLKTFTFCSGIGEFSKALIEMVVGPRGRWLWWAAPLLHHPLCLRVSLAYVHISSLHKPLGGKVRDWPAAATVVSYE